WVDHRQNPLNFKHFVPSFQGSYNKTQLYPVRQNIAHSLLAQANILYSVMYLRECGKSLSRLKL
ncbi:MAG: hypothetical protein ACR2P1_25735, partial [Pseudomonadales bacterium]